MAAKFYDLAISRRGLFEIEGALAIASFITPQEKALTSWQDGQLTNFVRKSGQHLRIRDINEHKQQN